MCMMNMYNLQRIGSVLSLETVIRLLLYLVVVRVSFHSIVLFLVVWVVWFTVITLAHSNYSFDCSVVGVVAVVGLSQ